MQCRQTLESQVAIDGKSIRQELDSVWIVVSKRVFSRRTWTFVSFDIATINRQVPKSDNGQLNIINFYCTFDPILYQLADGLLRWAQSLDRQE